MLAGVEGERLWAYWRRQLAGQLPVLDLPTDRPRQPIQTHRGGSHDFVLSDELSGRLKLLAKAQGATLYVVMLAAFQAMLHYLSGQDDLIVGSPVVGRSRAEFEEIVGLFTNPVFLRVSLSGDPTFQEFVSHVRQTVLDALEHQDFPTLLLVERLKPARDLSRPPICQVMFVLDKPHGLAEQGAPTFIHGEAGPTMNSGGLVLESFPLEHRSASLDLVLLVVESTQSLSISMRYNAELFDHSTIVRFGKYFEALLQHVVAHPDARLSALAGVLDAADPTHQSAAREESEILDDGELARVLVEFNQTAAPYPDEVCIHACSKSRWNVRQTGLRSPSQIKISPMRSLTPAPIKSHTTCERGELGRKCRWRFAWSGVSRWSSRSLASSRRAVLTCRSIRLTPGSGWNSFWKMLGRKYC